MRRRRDMRCAPVLLLMLLSLIAEECLAFGPPAMPSARPCHVPSATLRMSTNGDDGSGREPGSIESREFGRFNADVRPEWRRCGSTDVLVPRGIDYPLGLVHFIGGSGVGAFPRNAYSPFLEGVAKAGFVVLATPVRLNEFNHELLACEAVKNFAVGYREVERLYGRGATGRIPVFGLGHSLGSKLHVLLNSYPEVREVGRRRKANVFVSFNNFRALDSVPLLNEMRAFGRRVGDAKPVADQLSELAGTLAESPFAGFAAQGLLLAEEYVPRVATAVSDYLSDVPQEFRPTPEETWDMLRTQYSVRNNLVLQFRRDSIDESPRLAETLFRRFAREGELQFSTLDGTHVTPNTPDMRAVEARDWGRLAEEFGAPFGGVLERGAAAAAAAAPVAAAAARRELDGLVASTTAYLKLQALWSREEPAALGGDPPPRRSVGD